MENLKVIITSALIDAHSEIREQEYRACIDTLLKYGIQSKNIAIVECVETGRHPTYLDTLPVGKVFYSKTHDNFCKNKGVLEGKALRAFCRGYGMNYGQNELVVKLTGRYCFTSPEFLENIAKCNEVGLVDLVAQVDETGGQYRTGCFAIRFKHLEEFVETLDYVTMENRHVNIELRLYQYAMDQVGCVLQTSVLNLCAVVNNEMLCNW